MKVLASIPIRFVITDEDDIANATRSLVNAGFSVMENHPVSKIGDEVKLSFDFKIMAIYVNKLEN